MKAESGVCVAVMIVTMYNVAKWDKIEFAYFLNECCHFPYGARDRWHSELPFVTRSRRRFASKLGIVMRSTAVVSVY